MVTIGLAQQSPGFSCEILKRTLQLHFSMLETLVTTGRTCFYIGIRADFNENLTRHIRASTGFRRTYASFKRARWLLDMNNNYHDILAISKNVRCSCVSLKEPVS